MSPKSGSSPKTVHLPKPTRPTAACSAGTSTNGRVIHPLHAVQAESHTTTPPCVLATALYPSRLHPIECSVLNCSCAIRAHQRPTGVAGTTRFILPPAGGTVHPPLPQDSPPTDISDTESSHTRHSIAVAGLGDHGPRNGQGSQRLQCDRERSTGQHCVTGKSP